jgi:alkylation response protein AidB-like acyl-CoA dehydrogenase
MDDHRTAVDRDRVVALVDELVASHPPATTDEQTFWGAQFDAGLAWVDFPVGRGGLGLGPALGPVIRARIAQAGGSLRNFELNVIGIGMGAATILTHGREDQIDKHLRKIFTCEHVFCQLFSEPGAGSDFAGLATSAVKDGDDWILNGQKVWTTLAHVSQWGLLVARHNPDEFKHKGMTYFLLDMAAPGVEVKPLHQITAEAEFNEVYMTDVHVPDEHRLGEVGQGWAVAMTTLMNERVAIGGRVPPRGEGVIAKVMEAYRTGSTGDSVQRDEMVKFWIEAEALRLTNTRAGQSRQSGTPGPEGSTGKLHWADLNKRITNFAMDLLGEDGLLMPGGYQHVRPDSSNFMAMSVQKAWLRAKANSIEGGTSEVMKNILGEQVLGLPGEPRVDKGMPWKEVARG